jgi:hypothetical protein
LRLQRHAHGHGVDEHLVPGHVGVLARDRGGDLVPHHHAMALRVRLGDDGEELARTRLRQLESVAHDPGDAGAGENGELGADFLGQAAMNAPAGAGVFAFGVLADDDPVEVARADAAQRRLDAGQDPGGSDVGVLVEALADRETQSPEGDMVGHVRRADGAEINRIEGLQRLEPVRRHHRAVLPIVVGTPIEGFDVEADIAEPLLQALEDGEAGGDHFGADPVGGNRCNRVLTHGRWFRAKVSGRSIARASPHAHLCPRPGSRPAGW